jgi:hypothetical protein
MSDPLRLPRREETKSSRPPYITQFIEGVNSVLSVALALLGAGGLWYKLLVSGGWISLCLGERWTLPAYLDIVVPLVAVSAMAAAWLWLNRNRSLRRHSDVPLYLFMALGVYFLFKLISTGLL